MRVWEIIPEANLQSATLTTLSDGIHIDMDRLKKGEVK